MMDAGPVTCRSREHLEKRRWLIYQFTDDSLRRFASLDQVKSYGFIFGI
jgi:hypothetical protein